MVKNGDTVAGVGAKRTIGKAAALKRLKAFYNVDPLGLEEDLGQVVDRETDRGAVIILSTGVEDALARRIRESMVKLTSEEADRLFGPDAPIGTFSAKIKMAYAFGLIDRDLRNMCDALREMRNACAHSGRDISFNNSELLDALKVVLAYVWGEELDFLDAADPLFIKLTLIWIIGWIVTAIRTGSKEEATETVNALIADLKVEVMNLARSSA